MANFPIINNLRIVPRSSGFLDRHVGGAGEVFFDRDTNALRVFDGDTPSGFAMAKADLTNISDVDFQAKAAQANVGGGAATFIGPDTPDGARADGEQWLDTNTNVLYVWTGSEWIQPVIYKPNNGTGAEISFPATPTLNQELTEGTTTWRYNGVQWDVKYDDSPTFANLTVNTNLTTENFTINGTLTGVDLEDLGNVSATAPTDEYILQWDAASSTWGPAELTIPPTFNGGTITNPLILSNTAAVSSSDSGALRVAGGVGVAGSIWVDNTVFVDGGTVDLRGSGNLRFYNNSNTNYIGLSAPNTIASNRIYILPEQDGDSGQYLRTDGSGNLSWAAVTSPSGGTPPGGNSGQVQFNNAGEFGGSSGFTFNVAGQIVTVPKLVAVSTISINDGTESTDTTTGALTVTGGVGIGKQLNVGGGTNTFTGTTASTSTTTGTVVVSGGVGVGGAMNVGENVTADTDPTVAAHLTNKRYVDANVLAFSVAFGA